MNDSHNGREGPAWALLGRYAGPAVALVAIVPRTFGFREWWLNPDEGNYYAIFTRASGVWRDILDNAHPPLFYLLLRVLGFVTDDFFWFRIASLAFGVLAVLTFWLAARELAGPGKRGAVAGLVGALLVAFAPGAVELSKVIRPYTLLLALLAAALWLLLRHLRTGSSRALGGYVALVCLALLTHYSAVLALVPMGAVAAQQGLERRWGRDRWRRLALAHAVPAGLLAALYVFHMRRLVGGTLADAALGGWLRYYMVGSPVEAWIAFMGFLKLVGEPWLGGPLAVCFVGGLAGSAVGRDRRPFVLGTVGLAVALLGAGTGLYPLGPSRHAVWLMALVVPVVAWLAAELVSLERRTMVLALGASALLLVGGDSVGRALGQWRAPGAAPERVLRRADLVAMQDVLDPQECSRLIVMSRQTFYLLLPLLPREWEAADHAADRSVFHFRIGPCDVVTATGWDLRAVPDVEGDTSYLLDVLRAADDFAGVDLARDSTALILAGGWALPVVSDLDGSAGAGPLVLSRREVPGLIALHLDVDAYLREATPGRPMAAGRDPSTPRAGPREHRPIDVAYDAPHSKAMPSAYGMSSGGPSTVVGANTKADRSG